MEFVNPNDIPPVDSGYSWSTIKWWFVYVPLGMLLLALPIGCVFWVGQMVWSDFGHVGRTAFEAIETNHRLVTKIGAPIQQGMTTKISVAYEGNTGTGSLRLKVIGSESTAKIDADLIYGNKAWTLTHADAKYPDGSTENLFDIDDLTAEAPAPVQAEASETP